MSKQTTLSDPKLAKELLEIVLKSQKNTYIVIDGLDEYSRDDRKEISTYFQEIVHSLPTHDLGALRCLFVSQDDGYARKDLSKLSQIKITVADNKDDIRSYSQLQHQKIEEKFEAIGKLRHNIADIVTARAQGKKSSLILRHS
jgi:hypothetical protein